ncbi:MAG: response regulator [Bdellovibrionales bacterium]|nr:response regulator [Bdellovibrionales bacterium]
MDRKRIHVIEDEADIATLIQYNLSVAGFDVTCSNTGEVGLDYIKNNDLDLILLDLMLPGIEGLEICRQFKSMPEKKHIPIIMVTARGAEGDIVRGLELGADDYVTKPFSPKVLVARVNTVLRRIGQAPSSDKDKMDFGDLVIHPKKHEVWIESGKVDLTRSEFQILQFLAEKPGWVFTRSQIVDAIRGDHYAVTDRTIDFQMVGLRKKLGDHSELIETVRGVGYRFRDL